MAVGGAGGNSGRAGLLLPLTGRFAGLGASMSQAARLAAPETDPVLRLDPRDTAEAGGAANAATRATTAGAGILLGPVFAEDARAARAAAPAATPVVAFSNTSALEGPGLYVMGLTPAQSIAAILLYARRQGVRRAVVLSTPQPIGREAEQAARRVGAETGIEIAAVTWTPGPGAAAGGREQLLSQITSAAGGRPDAVLIPEGGETLLAFARLLSGAGLQLLGTTQWTGGGFAAPELDGAWFAAPDPAGFAAFADSYSTAYGQAPGVLAGLAYDAVIMARLMAGTPGAGFESIARADGFPGVVGRFRFRPDGRCERDLAILAVSGGGASVVDSVASA